jgi:hypothetical protein
MEGWQLINSLVQPNDWFCKIDLKNAYLSVPMHESAAPFLGFQFEDKFYQWITLPFGLSQAPWVFTK